MYPLSRVIDTHVYDECFFVPSGHFYMAFRYISATRTRTTWGRGFSRELFVIFRSICGRNSGIFYTLALCPLRDCRRGERRRDEINLGQSPPFSFREKETAAFPSSPFSAPVPSFPTLERQSNRNEAARYAKYVVAFTPVFSYATRSTANYVGNDTLREAEIASCSRTGSFK